MGDPARKNPLTIHSSVLADFLFVPTMKIKFMKYRNYIPTILIGCYLLFLGLVLVLPHQMQNLLGPFAVGIFLLWYVLDFLPGSSEWGLSGTGFFLNLPSFLGWFAASIILLLLAGTVNWMVVRILKIFRRPCLTKGSRPSPPKP